MHCAIQLLAAACLVASSSAGCREAAGDGEVEPSGVSYQRTVWRGEHEIFYEYDAPVAGAPVTFAFHVSDLSSGAPLESGRVALTAKSASGEVAPGEMVTAGLDAPTRAGIWVVEATFPSAGRWTATLDVPTIAASSSSVDLPPIEVAATADDVGEAEPELDGIVFLKEQQWPFRVRTTAVERRSLVRTIRVPATVRAHPDGRVALAAPVAGVVQPPANGALPLPGKRVEAGDVLARIEPPLSGSDLLTATLHHHELQVMEAELAVKLAQSRADEKLSAGALALASAVLERTKRLADVEAKSRRELEEAEFEAASKRALHDVALAVTKLYEAALEEMHSHPVHDESLLRHFPSVDVVAPIAGVVDRVRAVSGENVEANAALFTVTDPARVHVVARVPEHHASRIGAIASARLSSSEAGSPDLRLVHRALELDDDRTLPAVFEADNDGRLAIGQAVDVDVPVGPARELVAIPESAIVDVNGASVVFVQLAGELFAKRFVETGARDRGWIAVVRGVDVGERVVRAGAYLVHLASVGTSAPAHHHH